MNTRNWVKFNTTKYKVMLYFVVLGINDEKSYCKLEASQLEPAEKTNQGQSQDVYDLPL